MKKEIGIYVSTGRRIYLSAIALSDVCYPIILEPAVEHGVCGKYECESQGTARRKGPCPCPVIQPLRLAVWERSTAVARIINLPCRRKGFPLAGIIDFIRPHPLIIPVNAFFLVF